MRRMGFIVALVVVVGLSAASASVVKRQVETATTTFDSTSTTTESSTRSTPTRIGGGGSIFDDIARLINGTARTVADIVKLKKDLLAALVSSLGKQKDGSGGSPGPLGAFIGPALRFVVCSFVCPLQGQDLRASCQKNNACSGGTAANVTVNPMDYDDYEPKMTKST